METLMCKIREARCSFTTTQLNSTLDYALRDTFTPLNPQQPQNILRLNMRIRHRHQA